MNISSFHNLVTARGWKLIRRLNTGCQYQNLISGKTLTVTICDTENVPDSVAEKFSEQ